jgi:imidazolonepropionase-like amidohydrolase
MSTSYAKLTPQPTPDTQPYWDGLTAHVLRLQRCADCGKVRHYPRPVCDACYSMRVDWIDASGRGNVHSWTTTHHAFHPGFKPDLKLEAMLPVLEGRVPIAVPAARASVIHDVIAFAEKQKVKLVILQPHDIAKAGAELKAKNIPVIFGPMLALPQQEDDAYDESFTLPNLAYKAGVKFAFGTFNNEFVRNLPYQAATAVAFGLPYEEALKAVTINPAEIWGHGKDIGSVEKGKWADLMVTTGDPLEVQTQMKYLFIKGKEVSLTNKQTRLYDRYMTRQ